MNHVSVSPTDGNGPTQGQRKPLTRVGIEPTTFGLDLRSSTDYARLFFVVFLFSCCVAPGVLLETIRESKVTYRVSAKHVASFLSASLVRESYAACQ